MFDMRPAIQGIIALDYNVPRSGVDIVGDADHGTRKRAVAIVSGDTIVGYEYTLDDGPAYRHFDDALTADKWLNAEEG